MQPSRRRFLTQGPVLAASLLLAQAPEPAIAASISPSWHVEYGADQGHFHSVKPFGIQIIPWPTTSDRYPDPRGLISSDRTEISLPDQGNYLVTWILTWESAGGLERKTSLDLWTPEDGWKRGGDGNEMPATPSLPETKAELRSETTCVGLSWIPSDGSARIRVMGGHDCPHSIQLSDRNYETKIHIAYFGDSA